MNLLSFLLMFCLIKQPSKEEMDLFNKINQYRVKNGKTALAYCDSLSYVAEVHSIDLYKNFSIDNPHSMHSWSISNYWTGGYIDEKSKKTNWNIMYSKPKELLGMKVIGYEIAVMNEPKSFVMTPDDALETWINSPGHNNCILEKGWPRPFKRMGVSIYKGISTVWFSED